MTDTSTSATPTRYQRELLLAALDNRVHRLPHDARVETLDLMRCRQWIREHRADGHVLGTEAEYSGATHFRLTHLGVQLARKYQLIHLAKTYSIGMIAAYRPDLAKRHQDIVTVQSRPDADGNVKALSGQHRKLINVALTALHPAPPAAVAPGELTTTWAVVDHHATWLFLVEADSHTAARRAATETPDAKALSGRVGGFFYRRLRKSEVPPTSSRLRAATQRTA
jgi:hypothetical protein